MAKQLTIEGRKDKPDYWVAWVEGEDVKSALLIDNESMRGAVKIAVDGLAKKGELFSVVFNKAGIFDVDVKYNGSINVVFHKSNHHASAKLMNWHSTTYQVDPAAPRNLDGAEIKIFDEYLSILNFYSQTNTYIPKATPGIPMYSHR